MVRWCFFFTLGGKPSPSSLFSFVHSFFLSFIFFSSRLSPHFCIYSRYIIVLVHSFDTVSSSSQSFCFCFICAHMTDLRIRSIVLRLVRLFVQSFVSLLSLSLLNHSCIDLLSPICAPSNIYLLQHRLVVFNCCVNAFQMNENLAVGGGADVAVVFWYCCRCY